MEIPRPQPLGAFALPAGLLLIAGEDSGEVRQSLLDGRRPTRWPASLEGARLAYDGQIDQAIDWYAVRADLDPVALYNLWLLDPERVEREQVAHRLGEAWVPLVDFVAYALGLTAIPPAPERTTGELAALLATAQAAHDVEADNPTRAAGRLKLAAQAAHGVHPALEAILLAEYAGRAQDRGAADQAVQLLSGMDLPSALGEALFHQAGLIHSAALEGKAPIGQAIATYTQALRQLSAEEHPSLIGRIHLNLGTAYLAMPVTDPSDGLRAGIAIQSLRTAVRLLDEIRDPEEWATARLNLANALVYAPSAGQRDNIMEAVDLYEVVAAHRQHDKLGRARALANQGNALAHLGLLDDARRRFGEARRLFNRGGDPASAAMVDQMEASLD